MTIIMLQGTVGSGKTLALCYLGIQAWLKGLKVYADFLLQWHGFQALPFDSIMEIRQAHTGLLLLDDPTSWIDSRQAISNYKITWLIGQSRKRGLDIAYSTQSLTGVDNRLREITHVVVKTYEVQFPYFRLVFISPSGERIGETIVEYSEDVYTSYNTDQIVEQRVPKQGLGELYNLARTPGTFAVLANSKYNLKGDVAKAVFELIRSEQYPAVDELLANNGYTVVV